MTSKTSSRDCSIGEALARARSMAAHHAITRLTDITRLDRIGILVFASIRPGAKSLSVNAGKGYTAAAAQLGAIMEAIEFSCMESEPPPHELRWLTAQEARDSYDVDILAFCPQLGAELQSDIKIAWLEAELLGGGSTIVPLETVLHPCPQKYGPGFLGSNSNGVGAGFDKPHAVAHAICEALERDVHSFEVIAPSSRPVRLCGVPSQVAWLVDRITNAGLELRLLHTENWTGFPFFEAILFEPGVEDPTSVNGGLGFDPIAETAAVKAILEAVQSRLTYIHGGRDDIESERWFWSTATPFTRSAHIQRMTRLRLNDTIPFAGISEVSAMSNTQIIDYLCERIAEQQTLGRPSCYSYRTQFDDLFVCRVIVPGAENFLLSTRKFGRRLQTALRNR